MIELRCWSWMLALSVSSLVGCSGYEPRPLPVKDGLHRDLSGITVDLAAQPHPSMRAHRFDPTDGFDETEVAMIAITNNPDLRLARADLGIARAQAYSAGLLPDPQFNLTREQVMGGPPGATTALTAGLTIDVMALVSRSVSRRAAEKDERKAELNLLWQEWQVVAQARLLFLKRMSQASLYDALDRSRAVFQDRLNRTRAAADRGLLATDAVTPHLTALQDVTRQMNDLQRQRNQSRHDLDALLGVAPEVEIRLVGDAEYETIDEGTLRVSLSGIASRRPDLLALRTGYGAEDDRYRAALLAQFPAFVIGPTRARDTSHVDTAGFSIGLTLPIFNRNRGNIAIERATRERLGTEFQQRLDATVSEVDRLLAEQRILQEQLGIIAPVLAELQRVADRAELAFTARNIDPLVLTNAQIALLNKQVEQINLREAIEEQRCALQTLIGGDLPVAVSDIDATRADR